MIEVDPIQVWKEAKFGKFSASEEDVLLTPGFYDKKTGITPMFGLGALTYIEETAVDAYTIYSEEDNPETFEMKMGKAKEGLSFAWLLHQLGRDVLDYYGTLNPFFHLYTPDSGTSPDSVAWKDYEAKIAYFGAELKNPSRLVHAQYLRTIKDQYDLKTKKRKFYTQVQKAMMTFKCDLWLWCTHNEYFRGKDRMLIIEVKEDRNFQNELDARIAAATKLKYEFIEQLKNRE